MGGVEMNIVYNDKNDLLYIRLDDRKQDVINRRVSDDVVLDIGERDRIIGIEIIDASKHVSLDRLLPVKYEISKKIGMPATGR
jgi:uncharacterized protein YuzE